MYATHQAGVYLLFLPNWHDQAFNLASLLCTPSLFAPHDLKVSQACAGALGYRSNHRRSLAAL